jgi:hypothetical protein
MAFDPEPAMTMLDPVAGNPSCGWKRRALIMARNPGILGVFPSPMARDPNINTPWRRRTWRFGNKVRRRSAGMNRRFGVLRIEENA